MSKRSPSFIKNKWVGAASQITRRTIRETTSDEPIGLGSLGTIRRGAAATAASDGSRRNGTADPPEWREFSREMIDVLREIQGQTTSNRSLLVILRLSIFQLDLFYGKFNCLKLLG